jgi:hypothetical protein
MSTFELIHPKGNVILDVIHCVDGDDQYYSVILTYPVDEQYKKLLTFPTHIEAATINGAIRLGLEGIGKLYNNICSIVTVYEGATGKKIKSINLNQLAEDEKELSSMVSSRSPEELERMYKQPMISKSLH